MESARRPLLTTHGSRPVTTGASTADEEAEALHLDVPTCSNVPSLVSCAPWRQLHDTAPCSPGRHAPLVARPYHETYTDPSLLDVAGAVEALPELSLEGAVEPPLSVEQA